jgi:hypothetical protein
MPLDPIPREEAVGLAWLPIMILPDGEVAEPEDGESWLALLADLRNKECEG